MDRRMFLAAASTPLLAGCSSIFGDSPSDEYPELTAADSGPPYYSEVNLSAPDEVEVGEQFNYTLSVANTGGRAGNFSSSLSVGEDASIVAGTAEVSNIEPGTRKSATIGPEQANRPQKITVQIPDHGASTTVEVVPAKPDWSEPFTLYGFEIQFGDVSFQPSFTYLDEDTREVVAADESQTLAFVDLSVTAVEETDREFPSVHAFTLMGDDHTDDPNTGTAPDDIDLYSGGGDANPGASRSGTLIFEVPTDIQNPAISWAADSLSGPSVIWEFDEDLVNRLQTSPAFDTLSNNIPSEIQVLSPTEASVTIKNTGERPGTLNAVVQRDTGDYRGWTRQQLISEEIAGNESTNVTFKIEETDMNSADYRLAPLTDANTVDVGPAERTIGEEFVSPGEIEYIVDDIQFYDEFEFESGYDSTSTATTSNSRKFAFLKIEAENIGSDSTSIASGDDFSVIVDGSEYSLFDPNGFYETFADPAREEYSGAVLADTGYSTEGWAAFKIPAEYDSLRVRLTLNHDFNDVHIEWSD